MMNIIMFGPPGAGKGTQSLNIARQFQLKHTSTGDLLREEIKQASPLGLDAKKFMDKGMLVPDETLMAMIKKVLDENSKVRGFIFDGFPRTLTQARELDRVMKEKDLDISLVVYLSVEEEELFKRMMKRAAEQGRSDDKPEVIKQRLETYRLSTEPLLDYYDRQQKLVKIEGVGTVEMISGKIFTVLENLSSKFVNGNV